MTDSDYEALWPQDIITQAVNRNLVLVIGSGLSASCEMNGRRPPGWETLLRDLVSSLSLTDRQVEIDTLLSERRLLDAAELIKREARRVSREQDFFDYVRKRVDGKAPNNFDGSDWHEAVVRLEPNLIVTTNYDRIIERATKNGFSLHSYESGGVAGDIRRGEPTLLKIHGTVDRIEDIVLTRTDYTRLRVTGAHALAVLQSILLTRTVLLLGYTLRDPDLQLLFENVLGGRGEVAAHYMLAPDSIPDYERDVLRYSFGVSVIGYPQGMHSEALAALQWLADVVQAAKP